jgi:nucleotide-binding universal stress UspA family protein
MFHSILVGFDGSPHARRALDEAVALARSDHATLTVMAVVPAPSPLAGIGALGYGGADLALAEEALEHDYAQHLDAAVDALPSDLSVTKLLVHGKPGPELVRRAREAGHDLVVVGCRGLGTAASIVLGSVSGYVLHHLPGAVLVMHAEPVAA